MNVGVKFFFHLRDSKLQIFHLTASLIVTKVKEMLEGREKSRGKRVRVEGGASVFEARALVIKVDDRAPSCEIPKFLI